MKAALSSNLVALGLEEDLRNVEEARGVHLFMVFLATIPTGRRKAAAKLGVTSGSLTIDSRCSLLEQVDVKYRNARTNRSGA